MKVMAFLRSLILLVVFVIAVPWVLIAAASVRFDGRTPWFGVSSPADWRWHGVQATLTDRLTEATIADIVIRVSLGVAWVAFATIIVTVFAELAHMARHQGLPMPDIRGLAMPQRFARVIAAGLLVAIPMVGSPARVQASDTAMFMPRSSPAPAHVMSFESPGPAQGSVRVRSSGVDQLSSQTSAGYRTERDDARVDADVASAEYVVKAGDSIYGIAGRLAGPGAADVTDYAEQILDLNLGRTMPDGQQFNNAAYIDVGWTLELPARTVSAALAAVVGDGLGHQPGEIPNHMVREDESLWSIAETELGDGQRWNEVFAANEGRTFGDGRTLADPGLIQAGWDLVIPGFAALPVADASLPAELPVAELSSAELPDTEVASPTPPPAVSTTSDSQTLSPDVSTTVTVAVAEPTATAGDIARGPVVLDPSSLPTRARQPAGSATQPLSTTLNLAAPESTTLDSTRPDSATLDSTMPDSALGDSAVGDSAVVNSWQDSESATTGADSAANTGAADARDNDLRSESTVRLFTLERAAMLAGGVLLLLAARRRQLLRAARPRARVPSPAPVAASTERQLRAIGGGERFARVDLAVRAAAPSLAARGSRVAAVLIAADGAIELWATGPANLQSPWRGIGDRWSLPGDVSIEALATEARRVVSPAPTLVQLGVQHGAGRTGERDVYVDLESIGAVEVGGSGAQADSIVVAIASTLASSVLAEVTTLIGLGVPDEAFLGHRLHVAAHDHASAFAAAAEALGTTAHQDRSTFDLRVHATGGDTWEPAVVLVGASVGDIPSPANTRGLALVSGSAIIGPSSRLAPDGDAWMLRPIGLRFVPIGLTEADLVSLVGLVEPARLEEPDSNSAETSSDDTIMGTFDRESRGDDDAPLGADPADRPSGADDATVTVPKMIDLASVRSAARRELDVEAPQEPQANESLAAAILIRIIGPVTVEAIDGEAVHFERSKTKELLAWMVTHRERSTRTLARTALWDLDVRDATFANVVSEARRALARLVEPPPGEEWVGRTLTEALPLHVRVHSDADVLTDALRAARLQPPSQAIATLTPAVDLIRGMPFEGASYLWPDPEGTASNLVLLATTAAAELAAHCLSIGDVEGVFAATARGLSVLSGHEELIGLRMRAHGDAGDLAGVRLEWESYSRALLADPWSDGEPSPKLVSLRTELLSPVR